ncbi:MAG TPA: hypothetical protein VG796_11670 [Verrucomicrobiales bacterium]|nr:hypothetical protein [Verrucomicrobiales bacterium]
MKRPAVWIRRIALLLAWGGSVAAAYYIGTEGRAESSAGETARTPGSRGPLTGAGGPLSGKPGSVPEGENGNAGLPGKGGKDAHGVASRTVDFKAKVLDIEAMPPGPQRKQAWLNLMKEWAAVDGEAALTAAAAITEPLLRYEMRETALRHWAAANPEAAWKYAKENPKGDLPDERMDLVWEGLGRGDAATSLAFLEKHSKDLENSGGYTQVFDDLYERGNHDQLVAWAEKMPAGRMRDMAANRIIDRWARYDPLAAKEWMERNVTTKDNLVPARVELAESWARVNPEKAIQWANSLPANQRETEYYNRIYNRWIQYDRNAAAKYLASQPPSPQLDRPVERYTYEVMRQNPAETMPWAESISDQKRRWEAITRVADIWRKRDPAALQNYVMAGSFNEDQRRQLLRIETKK